MRQYTCSKKVRRARISRYDQQVVGVCIYLTPGELAELGIDFACLKEIEYRITDGPNQAKLVITGVQEKTE